MIIALRIVSPSAQKHPNWHQLSSCRLRFIFNLLLLIRRCLRYSYVYPDWIIIVDWRNVIVIQNKRLLFKDADRWKLAINVQRSAVGLRNCWIPRMPCPNGSRRACCIRVVMEGWPPRQVHRTRRALHDLRRLGHIPFGRHRRTLECRRTRGFCCRIAANVLDQVPDGRWSKASS